jgi:lipoprotein LprG
MRKFLYLSAALCLVLCAVLAGCSSNKTDNMTTADILTKSYDSMQAAKSFHFTMAHDTSGTPISKDILMTKLSGDIVSPDKLQATISGTYSGAAIEVKLVTVSGKTYMTNPISGIWEAAPDSFKVLSVFDPGTGVAAIIKGLTDTENLGDDKVGSSKCYHLKGNVLSETLAPLTGTTATGVKIGAEVWIDKKTFLVSQVKLTGKITDSETDGITRTLNFTNYNKNIDIELPTT